jgi:hypothetical protein
MSVNVDSLPAVTIPKPEPYLDRFAPPLTTEDRVLRIRMLGDRIGAYIQFMCAVGNLEGSSVEAKQTAVTAFYERLCTAERQLGRIKNDLQLG